MKEIKSAGNLPKCFQAMAKEFQGERSTIFYECINPEELLGLAKNKECEELTCVLDQNNARGYMAGFHFKETDLDNMYGDKLVKMHVYFCELSGESFKKYAKMLDEHRTQQEDDMIKRKTKNKGETNDK